MIFMTMIKQLSYEKKNKTINCTLPPHISYSRWQSFRNDCHWCWKLDNIYLIRLPRYSIHMDFGKCIHSAIELYKPNKNPITLDEACLKFKELFESKFDINYKFYVNANIKDKEKFINSGVQILKNIDNCKELTESKVLYNEHELYIPITTNIMTISFKGFIDMIIKTKDKRGKDIVYIIDFKTCSWGWNREKKTDKDLQYQLMLYKHFFSKKFDIDPKSIRTAFVLLKKTPVKNASVIDFFPVSAGSVSVQHALDELNKDLVKLKKCADTNNFKKDRKFCKNKYGSICPYFNTDYCSS